MLLLLQDRPELWDGLSLVFFIFLPSTSPPSSLYLATTRCRRRVVTLASVSSTSCPWQARFPFLSASTSQDKATCETDFQVLVLLWVHLFLSGGCHKTISLTWVMWLTIKQFLPPSRPLHSQISSRFVHRKAFLAEDLFHGPLCGYSDEPEIQLEP